MYGKVKLSKRAIKEDKFTTFMLSSKETLHKNWQFYVIGLIIAVLMAVAVTYYVNEQEAASSEAALQLATASAEFRNGNSQVAIVTLSQIVEGGASGSVGEQATYLLGKINYETRNYPEAIRYFEMYLGKYRTFPVTRSAALAGVASSLENQGSYPEAAQKFVDAAQELAIGPLTGDYRGAAMRNYLAAGEIDKARTQLEIVQAEFQGTDAETTAIQLFAEKSQL